MPIRVLLMFLVYVGVCVGIYKFWPQTDENVVVATQKSTAQPAHADAEAEENNVAANTSTTETDVETTETQTFVSQPFTRQAEYEYVLHYESFVKVN